MITEDEIRYYKQLDERQQRLFLGMKAKALGRSGVRLISTTFGETQILLAPHITATQPAVRTKDASSGQTYFFTVLDVLHLWNALELL